VRRRLPTNTSICTFHPAHPHIMPHQTLLAAAQGGISALAWSSHGYQLLVAEQGQAGCLHQLDFARQLHGAHRVVQPTGGAGAGQEELQALQVSSLDHGWMVERWCGMCWALVNAWKHLEDLAICCAACSVVATAAVRHPNHLPNARLSQPRLLSSAAQAADRILLITEARQAANPALRLPPAAPGSHQSEAEAAGARPDLVLQHVKLPQQYIDAAYPLVRWQGASGADFGGRSEEGSASAVSTRLPASQACLPTYRMLVDPRSLCLCLTVLPVGSAAACCDQPGPR